MALYLKHRPQLFSTIIGQDHIVQTVVNQVKTGKTAHAYLFSGPRGVGKTTLARILSKAVNCENLKPGESEPCNQCSSCLDIGNSRSIDVLEIDAASHTGVDNVRENIIDNAQFKPTRSKFKIFIIDEVHMLSTSAFNALLKTLEEPPTHVIFILATTELHKLPDTIISRCQRFEFKKVPFEIMKKHLEEIAKQEKIKIDKEVIERLIHKGDGCVRDSISLLDQLMASGEKHLTVENAILILPNTSTEQTTNFLSLLINRQLNDAIQYINQLAEEGINLNQFAIDTILLLRTVMIEKISNKIDPALDLSDKTKKELRLLEQNIEYQDLIKLIDLMLMRAGQIKTSPLPQMPLELVVVEWCSDKAGSHKPEAGNELRVTSYELPVAKNEQKSKDIFPTNTISPEKKSIVERVKDLVSAPAFSLDELNAKWSEFMGKIEKQFPTLSFILKMADIKNVENNAVILSVPYTFHRDKLTEKTIQRNLEDILSELLNTKARIQVLVVEKQQSENNPELVELASTFGGEIVN